MKTSASALRSLPAVDTLLNHAALAEAVRELPRALVVEAVRGELATERRRLRGRATTVVNHGTAAVLLVLSAGASGRRIVVSRGELIEIGGSFRIPDILAKSGAQLVEVGTTNRTHLRDYERAFKLHADVAAILRVHPSN